TWHARCHTDRDARSPVYEKVSEFGPHYFRFRERVVKVELEIDCLLINIGKDFFGYFLQPRLGIPQCSRAVTVDRPEVTLAIYQKIAQTPVLGHTHHGVIY